MKDYKLKLRILLASHTLGWSWNWNTYGQAPAWNHTHFFFAFMQEGLLKKAEKHRAVPVSCEQKHIASLV